MHRCGRCRHPESECPLSDAVKHSRKRPILAYREPALGGPLQPGCYVGHGMLADLQPVLLEASQDAGVILMDVPTRGQFSEAAQFLVDASGVPCARTVYSSVIWTFYNQASGWTPVIREDDVESLGPCRSLEFDEWVQTIIASIKAMG